MQKPEQFDAIVIGTGQGGGPLAGALSKAGKRVAILERGNVGGTCINTGCTPTKTMVASARVASLTRRAAEFGVHCGDVRVAMAEIRNRKQRIVEEFRAGSEKALENKENLELIHGFGRFVSPDTIAVGDRQLSAGWIFINTGTDSAVPDIPGIHDVPFLDNASIMELGEVPEHLLVIGGSYIACEFGQMFRRFGAKVTILARDKTLMEREDADVSACLVDVFEKEGIEMVFGAHITGIRRAPSGIDVTVSGKTVSGSHLLLAAGRTPNTKGLDLDRAGVEIDKRGYITVNEKLETSAKNIWAIGDVNGGPAFTHISYDDFRILRDNLLNGGSRTTKDRQLPYTVYTDPQVGRIGMSETEARKSGKKLAIAVMPAGSIARAEETGDTWGMLKIIVDRDTDKVLGGCMMTAEGGEMAAVVEMAMVGGITCRQIRDMVFAHPAWAESLNNLVGKLKDV